MKKQRRQYEGEKKKDYTVTMTPTAADRLMELGESLQVSRSQVIEMFARGEISTDIYQVLVGELQAS